jgi:hypothetical protein
MKYTVIKKIQPNVTKGSVGSTVKLHVGKHSTFSCSISETIMRRAKIVVGDRVSIQHVKDDRGANYVLLETDPSGYKITTTKSNGTKNSHAGEYTRAVVKTQTMEDFMMDDFSIPAHYGDNEVEAETGAIFFPFPKKRRLFSR